MSNLITTDYLKNNNPFSSEVYPAVQNIIKEREGHYSKKARGTSANTATMNWLYEKTAYVAISTAVSGSTDFKTVLEPPKGGFRSTNSPLYTSDLFPQPVVNSVRITNDGDYNTLMRASISFNVYSLPQLTARMDDLLKVGSNVKIDYGWTAGSYVKDPFIGVVYNFNWTLQPDGTFQCTSESVGEGFFPAGMRPDFPDANNTETKTDNTEQISQITWVDNIRNGKIEDSRVKKVKFLNLKSNEVASGQNGTKAEELTFVTLGYVAEVIQTNLRKYSDRLKNFTIVCNETVTKGHSYSIADRPLASTNPTEIIFPGKSSAYFGQGGKNAPLIDSPDFKNPDGTVNLSNIFININVLDECIKELKTQTTESGGKHGSYTLHTFFKLLFSRISDYSGEFYQLTLVPAQPPLSITDADIVKYKNTIMIVDTNFIETSKTSVIPVMTADGKTASGIARSVSLTSKLPQAMQVAQYIGTANVLTNGMTPSIQKYNGQETDTEEVKSKIKSYPKLLLQLQQNGWIKNEDSLALQSLYKLYKTSTALQDKNGGLKINSNLPIPLDLTITIDGTGGFRFGNNITIDYLPDQYKNAQFMITKIEHLFQNNDWTTTLNTVHRAS